MMPPEIREKMERLAEDCARYKELYEDYSGEVEELQHERKQLEAKIESLETALKKYANQSAWESREIQLGNGTSVKAPGLGMGPHIAREALGSKGEV